MTRVQLQTGERITSSWIVRRGVTQNFIVQKKNYPKHDKVIRRIATRSLHGVPWTTLCITISLEDRDKLDTLARENKATRGVVIGMALALLFGGCSLEAPEPPDLVFGERYTCEYMGEVRSRCVAVPMPEHGHCVKVMPPTPCLVPGDEQ